MCGMLKKDWQRNKMLMYRECDCLVNITLRGDIGGVKQSKLCFGVSGRVKDKVIMRPIFYGKGYKNIICIL